MGHYRIGQAAKFLGLSTVALRHYEKINLVTPSYRSMTGYRMYNDNDITRLKFVINAKKAGLSLSEIKKLLEIDSDDVQGSQKVKDLIGAKIAKLEASVDNTNYIISYLKEIDSLCDGAVPLSECPIMQSLRKGK